MDATRLELIEKHVAEGDSENVDLHAKDLCELVAQSGTDDPGLVQAAKAMEGHVGFVAVNRKKVRAMLGKTGKPRGSSSSSAGNTAPGTATAKS